MIEIAPYMYDCNTIEYRVRDTATGYLVADCCANMKEAEQERDAYIAEMHAFNDGPFSTAQSTRR